MQPLRGIVVVAVEQAVATPICTRHLGDLGARVIKIENSRAGDFARDYDDVVLEMPASWILRPSHALHDHGQFRLLCGHFWPRS